MDLTLEKLHGRSKEYKRTGVYDYAVGMMDLFGHSEEQLIKATQSVDNTSNWTTITREERPCHVQVPNWQLVSLG